MGSGLELIALYYIATFAALYIWSASYKFLKETDDEFFYNINMSEGTYHSWGVLTSFDKSKRLTEEQKIYLLENVPDSCKGDVAIRRSVLMQIKNREVSTFLFTDSSQFVKRLSEEIAICDDQLESI